MELSNAIDNVNDERSVLSRRNEDLEELLAFAVRRLVHEPFEVLAKGLNPSRFEGWSKGARSKVARQYGSASDLVAEVLRRASTPERGDLAGTLETAAEVIVAGEPYEVVSREFARAFYNNLANDDGFKVQILAWTASSNRESLRQDLSGLYDSMQERIALGITAVLESADRELKPGLTVEEQAAMLLAVTEGAVLQGAVRGHDQVRERYAEYVIFMIQNGSEPRTQIILTDDAPSAVVHTTSDQAGR